MLSPLWLPILLATNVGAARHHPPAQAAQTSIIAPIPAPPGFPEGLIIHDHHIFISAPATSGTAGNGQPSKLFVFDERTGELEREVRIRGEDTRLEHAVSGMALDAQGRIYVLSTQLGLVRIDLHSGEQETYASPLSSLAGVPPLPNDVVFDRAGAAYISDSLQSCIWRVPPGGGDPVVWVAHPAWAVPFGPNGLRLSPDERSLYLAVTGLGGPGGIYRIPLVARPQLDDIALVHAYPVEGPDGLAFANSGNLYVGLAVANAIAVLDPAGTEIARYSSPHFDSPAGLAFDPRDSSLLAANHALLTRNAASFGVLRIPVPEHGLPLVMPRVP